MSHGGRYEKREWRVCNKKCHSSRYLQDMNGVDHDMLGHCDFKVIQRVHYWNKMVGNMKVEEQLEERVGHQISGLWLCNVL